MPLSAGDRIGSHEILALIGAGGMGEVYRARDTKLKREVAIKVLPAAFAGNAERMARFQREAEVLASLNHPGIATLYGVEENALIMEYVEGSAPKGPLEFDDAWKLAMQIADALEYAHDRGVVHRDLKPANIKVTPEGNVKLLDFGLAKALQDPMVGSSDDPANSPTMTLGATAVGTILGTAAYMAPEQAKGKKVDRRADIWAWGVVLWELLTGDRMFKGEDTADTLAHVLASKPDFTRVPAKVRRVLEECLQKDPRQRLGAIGDAKKFLGESGAGFQPAAGLPPGSSRAAKYAWPSAAAALALALAAVSFLHFRETPPEAPLITTTILPPDNATFEFGANQSPPALSPDGAKVVFGAHTADNKNPLFVRALNSPAPQLLADTEGARYAFWSPDSRYVAFFADGKLKKIDTLGGPSLTLADAVNPRGGAWSPEGVILFAPTNTGPLLRIAASGGTPTPATTLDPKRDRSHRFPWFLADGRHYLVESQTPNGNDNKISLAILDSTDLKPLADANSNAVYSEGHLLYLRQSTLMAQPFDLDGWAVAGEAVPVAEQIQNLIGNGARGVFSVSNNGRLVYLKGQRFGSTKLTWFDRNGKVLSALGDPGEFGNIELSPDRKSAAVVNAGSSNDDLWIYDLARSLPTRFTFENGEDRNPVWSPDGRTIVFSSNRKGHRDLYQKAADGTGAEEIVYADGYDKIVTSWSPDGKFLLFTSSTSSKTGADVWVLPLSSQRGAAPQKPIAFVQTPFQDSQGQFSPNAEGQRWVAYLSNESQRGEVYVAPFPGPGGKRQVSTAGGAFPRWRRDGKEIFFSTLDGRLMAAEVSMKGSTIEIGQVRALDIPVTLSRGYLYDVSTDGQKILAPATLEQNSSLPLTLVQNWTGLLKK